MTEFSSPYNQFVSYVLDSISVALDKHEVDAIEAAALMLFLNEEKTLEGLIGRVYSLVNRYPFLKNAIKSAEAVVQDKFDMLVQTYIHYLLQKNRTNEVTDFNKNISKFKNSISDLVASYPEIKNFL